MKEIGRKGLLVGTWLWVCAVVGACGSGETGGGPGTGTDSDTDGGRKILRVAYEREIDVLNAFTSQNLVDIAFSMVEGLITAELDRAGCPRADT